MARLLVDHDDTILTEALAVADIEDGGEGAGLVFAAVSEPHDWATTERRLTSAFQFSREAVADGEPIVYIVRAEDLQGKRHPLAASVAVGLLSCARALAMEGHKRNQVANVVAFDQLTPPTRLGDVLRRMVAEPGVSGQLLDLGQGQLGRAAP